MRAGRLPRVVCGLSPRSPLPARPPRRLATNPTKHESLASSGVVFAFTVANLAAQCGIDVRALATPDNLDGPIRASIDWDRDGPGPLPPELVIAGSFQSVGGVQANGVARLDPAAGWQPLGSGIGGAAFSLAIDANNHLLVGGAFGTAGGVPATRIARFDGVQWHPLASPPPALTDDITAMAVHGASDLIFVENGQLRSVRGAAGGGGVAADGAAGRADCVFAEEAVEGRHDGGGDDEGGADGAAVRLGAEAAQTTGDISRGAGPGGGVASAGGAEAGGGGR
jgi:hypothetical protein